MDDNPIQENETYMLDRAADVYQNAKKMYNLLYADEFEAAAYYAQAVALDQQEVLVRLMRHLGHGGYISDAPVVKDTQRELNTRFHGNAY